MWASLACSQLAVFQQCEHCTKLKSKAIYVLFWCFVTLKSWLQPIYCSFCYNFDLMAAKSWHHAKQNAENHVSRAGIDCPVWTLNWQPQWVVYGPNPMMLWWRTKTKSRPQLKSRSRISPLQKGRCNNESLLDWECLAFRWTNTSMWCKQRNYKAKDPRMVKL